MNKSLLFVSSAIAIAAGSPAFSQAIDAAAATGQQTPSPVAGAPTQDGGAHEQGGDGKGIQDIVVTAQRRAENLQKSSVSIEVLSGRAVAAVTSPQDLTAIAPSVVIANQGPQTQVYIRGVGDATGNSQGQSAVAFNIDGIYIARQTSISPQMFDIDRIEILKGPQGTLYGRNASGGAVNVLTNRPKLDSLSAYGAAEFGNYDMRRGEAGFNVPLGSTAAIRIAGQITDRNGYLTNGTDDEHTKALRGRLLFQPSADLSMLLNADISHSGGLGGGIAVYPSPNGNPWLANTTQPYIAPFLFNPGTAPLTAPNDYYLDSNNRGVSLEANANLGFATLTFIPAYRYQDFTAVYYAANFRYAEHPITKQLSGELRLSHETRALKWVGGLYYFNENQDDFYSPTTGSLSAGNIYQNRKAIAVFGQATYSIFDRLRLIAGARYTDERVTGHYNSGTGAVRAVAYTQTSPTRTIVPIKENNFSYKVGGEYDLASRSMLYATYATGFKAGGFNPTLNCATDPYKGEKLDALTVGVRNRFFDNQLQVNVEGFRWKYKNQQATLIARNACGEIFQLKRNIGDATIQGANIDIVFRVTSADTLHGNLEYTHSKLDSFTLTQLGPDPYLGYGSPCSATSAGGGLFNINCAGQQLPRTPKWSSTFGYEHVFRLSKGNVTFDANGQYASSRWLDYGYVTNSRADGYVQLNAELTYNAPNDRWSLSAYVNNINNVAVYTGGSSVTFPATVAASNGSPYYVASIQPPRMYGARFRVKFGS